MTGTDRAAREILVSRISEMPEIPQWPDVRWFFEDGKYCLTETDVDLVLDYLENEMPRYRFEVRQYEEQLRIVLDGIMSI